MITVGHRTFSGQIACMSGHWLDYQTLFFMQHSIAPILMSSCGVCVMVGRPQQLCTACAETSHSSNRCDWLLTDPGPLCHVSFKLSPSIFDNNISISLWLILYFIHILNHGDIVMFGTRLHNDLLIWHTYMVSGLQKSKTAFLSF